MTTIPPDAVNWDSGDWIEWHRRTKDANRVPCTAASDDFSAKALSVYDALLHAARSYHKLTGRHLTVYRDIAVLYGAIHHPAPKGANRTGHTELALIPPDAATDDITVDLTLQFDRLLVVRIAADFKVDSRVIARADLPQSKTATCTLRWTDLPQPDHL